jgi:hypothetical protein
MRLNVQKTMVCCVLPDSRAKKVEPSPVDAKILGGLVERRIAKGLEKELQREGIHGA